MFKMPKNVSFDALTLVQMHQKKNKRLLELSLAKLNVSVSLVSVYKYLVGRAYLKKDITKDWEVLKEIYHIIPVDDEILIKSAQIDARLLRKGISLDFEDIIIGVTSILNDSVLITPDCKKYDPLRPYGLDIIPFEKFIRELEMLVEELSTIEKK